MNNTIIHVSDTDHPSLPFTQFCSEPEVLAKELHQKHSHAQLFLINVNYKPDELLRSQNAGIELLKYLRLLNLKQHCVLYSFLSREQLMTQDLCNLIIFSEGVTFIRLPTDLSKINFDELVNKTAPENLSAFFKAEATLPDDRHFFANWWGVLQLWKVQKAIDSIAGTQMPTEIKKAFTGSLKEMDSYQGLLAMYLHREKEKDVEEELKRLLQLRIERYGDQERNLDSIKSVLNKKTNELDDRARRLEIINESFYNSVTKTLFQSKLEELKLINDPIKIKVNQLEEAQKRTTDDIKLLKEYIELDALINEERQRIEEQIIIFNNKILGILGAIERQKMFSNNGFNIIDTRNRLQEVSPRILFVDDQADDGWSFIFQRIIYGKENDSFTIIQPCKDDSIEQITDKILERVNEFKPDLIILDLRLKGEHGTTTDVTNISGVQVLKSITNDGITCPVLITTASNKIWSYKETFSLGASAFWIKEGLDEHMDLRNSIENYMRFIDLVSVLCLSDEFQFLKRCKTSLKKLKHNDSKYWWESNDWLISTHTYMKTKSVSRHIIISILHQAIILLEDYLRLRLQESQQVSVRNYLPSAIIIRFASVLEKIHQTDNPYQIKDGKTYMLPLSEKIKDQFGYALNRRIFLLDMRNKAAHGQYCTFKEMSEFTSQLFEYLVDYHLILNNGK
ncbi:MAG: hypothetical protein IH598_12860 [Bacteroidales bacterium]|nr:hypothetical protein [Bacteroidales bacterium]